MALGNEEHAIEQSAPPALEIPFRPGTGTSDTSEQTGHDQKEQSNLEAILNQYVEKDANNRWHCKAPSCAKMFKGHSYWRKHIGLRHADWIEKLKEQKTSNQDESDVREGQRIDVTTSKPTDEDTGDNTGGTKDLDGCDATNDHDDTSSCGSWQTLSRPIDDVQVLEEYPESIHIRALDYEEIEKFYKAASDGDMETLRSMVERGVDVNDETSKGCTALVLAIMEQRLEAAEYLLKNGADVNHRVHDLPPLAHAACQPKNRLELCQLLVKYEANLNTISSLDSKNALHWAATEGMVDVVEYLLQQGMAVDKTCARGCTSLILAAETGHTQVAEMLLKHGADLNIKCVHGGTPLIWSSRHNRAETTKFWLDQGVDINETDGRGSTALRIASRSGHLDVVKLLLERGADTSIASHSLQDSSALMAAVCEGHIDIVKTLLAHGSDLHYVNSQGWTALDYTLDGSTEMVQVILEAMGGASCSRNSVSLQMAMAHSYRSMMSLISVVSLMYSQTRQSIDAQGDYDWLVWVLNDGGELVRPKALRKLMLAAFESEDIEFLKALISQNCDLSIKLDRGHTPLSYAVRHRNVEMVKLLLDAGADPNQPTDLGARYTPLDGAILQMKDGHDTEIVDLLLDSGRCRINCGIGPATTAFSYVLGMSKEWEFGLAEVLGIRMLDTVRNVDDDRCNLGNTLLHVAVWRQSEDFIDLLIQRGADIEAKNDVGVTPLIIACQAAPNMVHVLAAKGADISVRSKINACACATAAVNNNVDALEFLVNQGLDINNISEDGQTPLVCALRSEAEDAAMFLLEHGADVSWKSKKEEDTVLHLAIRLDLFRVARFLLTKDIDVLAKNGDGWTPLHEACATRAPWLVESLLDRGGSIEDPLPNGDRPLHVALINEQAATASLLIQKGADITARASQDRTPLHLAAGYSVPSVTRILLEQKGVSTEDVDEATWTPLCCATSWEVVEILLEHDANVNYKDCDGWTPLHQAVAFGLVDCATMLVHAGAKVDCRTQDDGLSVMDRAEALEDERKRRQMCFMLRPSLRRHMREARQNNPSVVKDIVEEID